VSFIVNVCDMSNFLLNEYESMNEWLGRRIGRCCCGGIEGVYP